MSSRIRAVLSTTFICVTAAVSLLVPAAASAAGATTIYACVSKKSGAMRVVSAKTKCRHGRAQAVVERGRAGGYSWRGRRPGSPGVAGTNGTNGVGVDYATSKGSNEAVHLASGGEDVVLSKTLPAGSYFVTAQTTLLVAEAKSTAFVVIACGIVDTRGHAGDRRTSRQSDSTSRSGCRPDQNRLVN